MATQTASIRVQGPTMAAIMAQYKKPNSPDWLPLAKIKVSANYRVIWQGGVDRIVSSLQARGYLSTEGTLIVVETGQDTDRWQVCAGHHRYAFHHYICCLVLSEPFCGFDDLCSYH